MDPKLGDFEAATAVAQVEEGRFRAEVPDGWQQGRGAAGGLSLGMLLRAMERAEADPQRRTRTLAGDICGPVQVGAVDIRVRTLRRGSNQTNLCAELLQANQVVATATAVLSAERPGPPTRHSLTPPPAGDWRGRDALTAPKEVMPRFTQHYDYLNDGPLPFGGAAEGACRGWIRERVPGSRLDAPALVGRLDSWWPTFWNMERAPRACATVQFTAEFFLDPGSLDAKEPLRFRSEMIALAQGFFLESRELWRGDALVALNQQTFAILG